MAERNECTKFFIHLDNVHDQSPAKRPRFEYLKEAELDENLAGVTAKSTKYATTHAVRLSYKEI